MRWRAVLWCCWWYCAGCLTPGTYDCSAPEDCASTHVCQGGACLPRCDNGETCPETRTCTAGVCVANGETGSSGAVGQQSSNGGSGATSSASGGASSGTTGASNATSGVVSSSSATNTSLPQASSTTVASGTSLPLSSSAAPGSSTLSSSAAAPSSSSPSSLASSSASSPASSSAMESSSQMGQSSSQPLLCTEVDPCNCWRQDPYAGAFTERRDIIIPVVTATQVVTVLDAAALGAVRQPDRSDLQVALCQNGVWTQVHRRIVNSSATTMSQELAVTFRTPPPATVSLLLGSATPPPVLEDPTVAFPQPDGTSILDTVAMWPLAGSTAVTGGLAVASTLNTLPLQWASASPVPQNLFVGGVEAGAIRGTSGRGLSGSLFTTADPVALPAGGGTPIHVRVWVHRVGGPDNQIIARTIGGLNGTTVGWQVWWEENFGRISFTVFDQRVGGCPGENTTSCTARVDATGLGGDTNFHFVEVSWSPNNGPMCIYVDGSRRGNRTGPNDIRQVAAAKNFHVGHFGDLSRSFDGNLGNLQVDTLGLPCNVSSRPVPPRLPATGALGPAVP